MCEVCVITGGGSGIGAAAARFIDKKKIIIISGRHMEKLEKAAGELEKEGHTVFPFVCDTSDRLNVEKLVRFALSKGEIKNVIHSAGVSPAMADPQKVLHINSLGTVYVNEEFSRVMKPGSVICDVASNSAYQLPSFMISHKIYELALTNEDAFLHKIARRVSFLKDPYLKSGFAYSYSKDFVRWYASRCAFEYGPRGIRVVSVSPGLIATGMGNLELSHNDDKLIAHTAEKRMGKPEELGFAVAMAADERNGYLAGVDVLVDGGEINGRKFIR